MMVIIGAIIVIGVIYLLLKRHESRMVLIAAGILMAVIAGKPMAALDAFAKSMTNAGLITSVCSCMGFAMVMKYTGCDKHLVVAIGKVLKKMGFMLIPGATIATFIINIAIPSAAGCSAAVGVIFIPILMSAGIHPAMAAAAVKSGTYGSMLNPGLVHNGVIAKLSNVEITEVITHHMMADIVGVIIAATTLTILAIFLKENKGYLPEGGNDAVAEDLKINPLYAQEKGVLRRAGHTEATIDMARLAGLYPAGALMEIMNEDGTMARLPELRRMADEFGLKLISIRDLIAYRLKQESIVEKGVEVDMPTDHGHFRLIPFRQKSNGLEHVALFKGTWELDEPILVRVHSSCATGDIFNSKRCDCGEQLHKAMEMIEKAGKGVVVYLNQEGRGIGLMEKMKAYKLQEEGMDTVDANICLGHLADERDYGVGAQILREIGVHKMRLMTNNPVKRVGLEAYGLEITENVAIETTPNPYNERYLRTKKERMGHTLHFNK